MSKISISRTHKLTHKKAVEVANQIAKELSREYGIESKWDEDTVHVKGSGITGTLHLAPKAIKINVTLGFMAAIFQQKIEDGIKEKLDNLLGT